MRRSYDSSPPRLGPPLLPGWARPEDGHVPAERAFLAGAGLGLLGEFLRHEPVYAGTLSDRLSLRAAQATVRVSGRGEDVDAIRDQWWLRPAGEALTPAARIFQGWRRVAAARTLTSDLLEDLAADFDTPLSLPSAETVEIVLRVAKIYGNPVAGAAHAAEVFAQREPGCEAMAHAVSDLALAMRLGWIRALPLVAWSIGHPSLRAGGNRRRSLPGDPDWSSALLGAYAISSSKALELAQPLALRAQRLLEFAPRLRAKGASRVVDMLLKEACVAGSAHMPGISDRAMRRLFDRLSGEGLVREVTGRPTFRLYGL